MTLMSVSETRELARQRKESTIMNIGHQIDNIKENFNDSIKRAVHEHESSLKFYIYHKQIEITEIDSFNSFMSELIDLNYIIKTERPSNGTTIIKIYW